MGKALEREQLSQCVNKGDRVVYLRDRDKKIFANSASVKDGLVTIPYPV